jgi:hypothetical protein
MGWDIVKRKWFYSLGGFLFNCELKTPIAILFSFPFINIGIKRINEYKNEG